MAPVVSLLQKDVDIRSTVCVTGQHREMLNSVLSLSKTLSRLGCLNHIMRGDLAEGAH